MNCALCAPRIPQHFFFCLIRKIYSTVINASKQQIYTNKHKKYRRNVQSKKALCTNTAPHLFIFSTHLLTSRPFFSCCYNSVIIIFHIAVISICT
ncbi:hypothetical protein ANACOL_03884 [Anaerotruncus colihominis DSM 17241]|uniref:Uncharacterized protein n=1 Tax=Anaerotruncus colihominis DSM 17241 TaxID=445972 RepID=B0PGF1_9FIRM|nr:hypothetical protein ANACOL_03884 [Anaerotruncus colihominis DSM 17241]